MALQDHKGSSTIDEKISKRLQERQGGKQQQQPRGKQQQGKQQQKVGGVHTWCAATMVTCYWQLQQRPDWLLLPQAPDVVPPCTLTQQLAR
jgi:hypothetical protein